MHVGMSNRVCKRHVGMLSSVCKRHVVISSRVCKRHVDGMSSRVCKGHVSILACWHVSFQMYVPFPFRFVTKVNMTCWVLVFGTDNSR